MFRRARQLAALILFVVCPIGTLTADAGEKHWAFSRSGHPTLPVVQSGFHGNAIDRFVLARLEKAGIVPSPRANRHTLIRRLSLDVLGLLPSTSEVAQFVSDQTPQAYERLVDRLLASPHFGERWGRHWLDLARYADSDGYLGDTLRPYAWVYRDWVINAINADMPFDQFTVEQLAGDLLPKPTQSQKIAVGFHRNTLKNTEAGADRELNRTKEIIDRVSTTGTVWMGLTVGCAECHNHKHDPISQEEFYQLYAFFNNTDEVNISAPQAAELKAFETDESSWKNTYDRLNKAVAGYEADQLLTGLKKWKATIQPADTAWTVAHPSSATSGGGNTMAIQKDGSIIAGGKSGATATYTLNVSNSPPRTVNGIRLEVIGGYGSGMEKGGAVGRGKNGQFILSSLAFAIVPPGSAGIGQPLKSVEVTRGHGAKDALNTRSTEGWSVTNDTRQYYSAVFRTSKPVPVPAGSRLVFAMRQKHGSLNTMRHFRISTTEATNAPPSDVPDAVAKAVHTSPKNRTKKDTETLAVHYRQLNPEWVRRRKPLEYHLTKRPSKPATKARSLTERQKDRRDSFIHIRGDYARPGKAVQTAVPAAMHEFTARKKEADRLDLAKWLIREENPLTARVVANRIWQRLFGIGLVDSSDDFGTKGGRPSHPLLLDWLAAELEETNWSRKSLIRKIVLAATYQQSSAVRTELANHPDGNRLMWRQNSFRLSAETVRDVHLVASGLFASKVGGPGIHPPLPAFVTEVGRSVKWPVSKGGDRYRRGLYIFFKRTVPYPMLVAFDAPDSSVSCSRRERTNSPSQALTLLNDPAFFECADALGKQFNGKSDPAAIRKMFTRCLNRNPTPAELGVLTKVAVDLRQLKAADPEQIEPMVGLARIIMNLDEFITRD
jgi:hypothetical protein